MKMNVKTNQLENTKSSKALFALLIVAVLLTLWTFFQSEDADNTDVIEQADQGASASSKKPMTSVAIVSPGQSNEAGATSIVGNSISWSKLKREPLITKPYNLFKVHSWVVVPPLKKVKPAPPPAPVAPPAPFVYMGKLEDTPKNTQIFLVANGKLYTTRTGEKIDQLWRLDTEEPNALRLTYLPLNLPQVLSKSARPVPTAVPVVEANL